MKRNDIDRMIIGEQEQSEYLDSAELLYRNIRSIWEAARSVAARSVNAGHACACWLIGRQLVESEQGGADRAEYGSNTLNLVSQRLTAEYGAGFSLTAIKYMRLFYLAYPEFISIRHALRDELNIAAKDKDLEIRHTLRDIFTQERKEEWLPGQWHPDLSWTHYRTLLKVERRGMRDFYEIEAINNNWSARHLERQINSLLFQRLLKSRDKTGVLELANEGQAVAKPIDIIKDPYVLEFLDLPESSSLVESTLEAALLTRLQDFLLELGQGFAFIGRQKRLTLGGDHFYPDLVFYHIKLRCYVIIDLKVNKLTHGDLGQMLMYVHYYDREMKTTEENPTIGLILCTDKNEAVVRYVLDEQAQQIFTSRYCMHLPTEEELQVELRRELDNLRREENSD